MKKAFLWFVFLFFMLVVFLPEGRCDANRSRFESLKSRLIADGFDQQLMEKFYSHPEARFLPQKVKKYVTYEEGALNYNRFLDIRFVDMGRQYLKQYQDTLRKAYEQYGTGPNVIVALLIVETQLGEYTGRHHVLNVLSSLAVAEVSDLTSDSEYEPSPEWLKKLEKRARWAYSELKAFFTYIIKQDLDPFSIKGSFAGAFGISQFVPSSLLNFGRDGDGDGMVDLYNHHDAIMSVAYYLSAHGWRDDASSEQKQQVLRRYNRSIYYVETVLELSVKLEAT